MTNIDEDVSEFLEHFGIKGQKWGIRRRARKDEIREQGRNFAERLLDKSGSKKMTEIPDLNEAYNNAKYSRHWYRINKTLEFLVERTN